MATYHAIMRAYRQAIPRLFCALFSLYFFWTQCPGAYGLDESTPEQTYRALTKKILLSILDLEKYNLRYRLESAREPKGKRIRYFLAQETGAATGLAYECVVVDQLREGRKRPRKINPNALKGGLRTVFVGSIIAGSGSALELTSNTIHAIKSHRAGMDSASAMKYMSSHLKELDGLLDQRDALVASYPEHPYFKQAELEGKVLRMMRHGIGHEFGRFYADVRGYRTRENVFYALNVATNTIEAVSIHNGIEGLSDPSRNGPANILFTIAGAMTIASPLLALGSGKVAQHCAWKNVKKHIGDDRKFDYVAFNSAQKQFADSLMQVDEKQVSGMLYRTGEYMESSQRSQKMMDSETKVMRYLNQVAVENAVIGPAIGATLMSQGIAGTVGYYKYNPSLKELDYLYKGAVAGLVGTSAAVGLTALGLVADIAYAKKLEKQKRLPRQLIQKRLEHIESVEKKILEM